MKQSKTNQGPGSVIRIIVRWTTPLHQFPSPAPAGVHPLADDRSLGTKRRQSSQPVGSQGGASRSSSCPAEMDFPLPTQDEMYDLFCTVVPVQHSKEGMVADGGFQRTDSRTASCTLHWASASDAHFICLASQWQSLLDESRE